MTLTELITLLKTFETEYGNTTIDRNADLPIIINYLLSSNEANGIPISHPASYWVKEAEKQLKKEEEWKPKTKLMFEGKNVTINRIDVRLKPYSPRGYITLSGWIDDKE